MTQAVTTIRNEETPTSLRAVDQELRHTFVFFGGAVSGGTGRTRQVFTPSLQWVHNHNLGFYPNVDLYDSGNQRINGQVTNGLTQTIVNWNTPQGGYIICS